MEVVRKSLLDSRNEALLDYERSQYLPNMYAAYLEAVQENNVEFASDTARAYRNRLLTDCDNMMVSDRKNVDTEAWKTYRQALRDVPKQANFPMNISWPTKPTD